MFSWLLLLSGCVDFDRDGWSVPADCDDENPGIHPGADELCDAAGVDEDCDGKVNDGDDVSLRVLFLDQDGDGAGDPATAHLAESCEPALGMVDNGADCDDEEGQVHVGATEVCDGRDNDCDGRVDDADDVVDPDSMTTTYRDGDGDGHGAPDTSMVGCTAAAGYVDSSDDCDDLRPEVSPSAEETCGNEVDDDCDGGAAPCGMSGDLRTQAVIITAPVPPGVHWIEPGGDLDGDAWPDLVVGSPEADQASVWFGPLAVDFTVGALPRRIVQGAIGTGFGTSVLGGRDLTGDGVPDLVVGAPTDGTVAFEAGMVWVVPGPHADADVLSFEGSVRLLGPAAQTGAGETLAWAGDVDGDGAEDLLVGARANPLGRAGGGSAYLLHGPVVDGEDLAWAEGIFLGSAAGDRFGSALAGVGDVDGDGLDDVVLGAPGAIGTGIRGAVHLLYGPATVPVEDADMSLVAVGAETLYGAAVAGADFDGDGHVDLVVGAAAEGSHGVVYVYDGASPPTDPTDAVATVYADVEGQRAGRAVATLADCNGDQVPDLAIGTPISDVDVALGGSTSVFYGPVTGTVGIRDAEGRYSGGGHSSGGFLRDVGDFDRDGLSDLAGTESGPDQGHVWLVYALGQ